jgi:NAD(P)-dependent dehydrogenase (short-subunit alcohol dehydrogenase family)
LNQGAEIRQLALSGKSALITGAASGIGRAIAELFAHQGAAVCLVDLDASAAQAVAESIRGLGGTAIAFPADVSRAEDCQGAVQASLGLGRGLHVVVNDAGVIRRASVVSTSEEDWDRVMAVNLKSVFLMSRLAIPHLRTSGSGVIINISSGWGLIGGPRAAAYCASKGAVVQLTRAMAIDHGSEGIRVNCICPGDTDTPMLHQEARELGEVEEAFLRAATHRPLQRVGSPSEIARAALFLASDASSFITGTALVVDGGGLAGS